MSTHVEVMVAVAQLYKKPVYLEIGVGDSGCFQQVARHCRVAVGVDVPTNPYGLKPREDIQALPRTHYYGDGSDAYFRGYPRTRFDLIFIDGDHHFDAVYRDFHNSLNVLAEGGTIAMHDTYGEQTGTDDAWEVRELIERSADYQCFTFPIPPGLSFVRPR